jgi:alkylation response protein AidB-like acyl-CoA dehydrogenase
MSGYQAPLPEMRFAMEEVAGLGTLTALPALEGVGPDLIAAVMEEAGKFAAGVLAPLNRVGDQEGARLENGVVTTTPGWKEAYDAFVAGGWNGLGHDPEWGGQGLPALVSAAIAEMWHAANMSFALCPMLTGGAVDAIQHHGSEAQKALYLPRLVTGEWTGTMCITEPGAGSDLSAVRTRAVREGDHYRITGQKIFITYGDHDLTPNIVHLVLARLPDAPEGVKGISLFIVPKFLPGADGAPGARNDVRTVSLEHKLGIHASPTAVLAFGDAAGAVGHLVGEENRGLEYMFTMMNNARLSVGIEGIGIAERAYQGALAYARERQQGRAAGERVAIIRHPDVRRMLADMKARIEAMRAVAYACAAALDLARLHPEPGERARQAALADLMVPVVKGWCTEWGVQIASTGLQVHGGMGYAEETGAAQHYRDARITTIYEGTTGIQAADLVGRKIIRDGGATMRDLIATMRAFLPAITGRGEAGLSGLASRLEQGIAALDAATAWLLEAGQRDPRLPLAGATPFLELAGTVLGGYGVLRGAVRAEKMIAAGRGDSTFLRGRLDTARFYVTNLLPAAVSLAAAVTEGSAAVAVLGDEAF